MRPGGRVATAVAMIVTMFVSAGSAAGAAGPGHRPGPLADLVDRTWAEYQAFAGAALPMPPVAVYTDPEVFAAAARRGVPGAPWAVGFYAGGRVHLKLRPTERENTLLLRHEMAHALLARPTTIPLWFNEGFATYMETRAVTPGGAEAIARAYSRTAVTLADFRGYEGNGVRNRYVASRLAVEYLVATRGEDALSEMVVRLRAGEPFGPAFREVYGLTPADLQAELLRAGARRAVA